MTRQIVKVGLAVLRGNSLLLVRKYGSNYYILPGGKPEAGEDDLATLAREIGEELGCQFDPISLSFVGAFSDIAAGTNSDIVTVKLYLGKLVGDPTPKAEIDEMLWYSPSERPDAQLAPSLVNSILPHISEQYFRENQQLRNRN